MVSLMIGSGIFLKPQAVPANSGSPGLALLMWVLGGAITLCCGLTIAEIAACIPKLHGLYAYLGELYGTVIGFLYGWVEAIISSPASCGAMAIGWPPSLHSSSQWTDRLKRGQVHFPATEPFEKINLAPCLPRSTPRVRAPIYRTAAGRWRHYARQIQPLRELLAEAGIARHD